MEAANKTMSQNAQTMEIIAQKVQESTNQVNKLDEKEQKLIKVILHHEEALNKLKQEQTNANNKIQETTQKLENQEKSLSKTQSSIITLSAAFQLFNQAVGAVRGLWSAMDNLTKKTEAQMQAEDKLAIVTKSRMGLNDAEVRSYQSWVCCR